jgi:hypothetical protein
MLRANRTTKNRKEIELWIRFAYCNNNNTASKLTISTFCLERIAFAVLYGFINIDLPFFV